MRDVFLTIKANDKRYKTLKGKTSLLRSEFNRENKTKKPRYSGNEAAKGCLRFDGGFLGEGYTKEKKEQHGRGYVGVNTRGELLTKERIASSGKTI